jgi:hypothetical protein
MKAITPHSLLTFTVYICLMLMALFSIAYWLVQWGKQGLRDSQEYDQLYAEIQTDLARTMDDHIHEILMYKLKKLSDLRWKNPEKTSVLYLEISIKYCEYKKTKKINL